MATAVQTFESSRTATAGKLDAEERRYGRGALVGAVAGFAIVAVFVGVLGSACGLEPAAAAGLAVFVAMFAGVGFGAMLGASLTMRP
ncbi:MAG: hypothetical protein KDB35_04705 [Acidimicrobiales bacterium]|nr:hypothetical protein [Acidimicrobiales bacterium]MCB1014549.1 hypothetical protein [Acidimicrobiales bacterium]